MFEISLFDFTNRQKGERLFYKTCKTGKTARKYWLEAVAIVNNNCKYPYWLEMVKNGKVIAITA